MAEPFISFVHPDDVAATRERSAAFADPDSDTVVTFENRYRTRSGDYRCLHWTTVAVDGVLYFAAKDVTDRRASETEREQAAGLSRAITDNVADGLLVAGSDGTIIYVEPGRAARARLRRRGADRPRLPGRPAGRRRASGARTARCCPVAFTVVGRPAWRTAWARSSSSATSARSAPRRAASDEAEQLIRNSEALHRTLTGNLPDTTVFLLDHELRILIADGEAIRRLGFLDADMFRGRKVAELYAEVPDDVLKLCLENYNAALKGERRAFEFASDGPRSPSRPCRCAAATTPSSPCSSSPATSPSAPTPRSSSRAAPASRTPSPRSGASRSGATI